MPGTKEKRQQFCNHGAIDPSAAESLRERSRGSRTSRHARTPELRSLPSPNSSEESGLRKEFVDFAFLGRREGKRSSSENNAALLYEAWLPRTENPRTEIRALLVFSLCPPQKYSDRGAPNPPRAPRNDPPRSSRCDVIAARPEAPGLAGGGRCGSPAWDSAAVCPPLLAAMDNACESPLDKGGEPGASDEAAAAPGAADTDVIPEEADGDGDGDLKEAAAEEGEVGGRC